MRYCYLCADHHGTIIHHVTYPDEGVICESSSLFYVFLRILDNLVRVKTTQDANESCHRGNTKLEHLSLAVYGMLLVPMQYVHKCHLQDEVETLHADFLIVIQDGQDGNIVHDQSNLESLPMQSEQGLECILSIATELKSRQLVQT